MKLRFFKVLQGLTNKRGQSAITLAMLTISFLLLSGFSLDVANLFIHKTRLQRALDAGGIGGISRYKSGITPTTIKDAAIEIAQYNLHEMGFSDSEITELSGTFTVDADQVATLNLSGKVLVNTIFMRLIPNAALATVTVSSDATARRNPAVISLVLDISGSMSEEIEVLKLAASSFVRSFEEGLDQMAIIAFADMAFLIVPMQPINFATFDSPINGLTANGYTGFSDAIAMGRKELEKVNSTIAVKSMVVFTDGAPTAIRPIFIDGKTPPLPKNYPPPANDQFYDYVALLAHLNQATPPRLLNPSAVTPTCRNACVPAQLPLCNNIANCLNSFAYNDSRGNPGHFSHIASLNSPYTEIRKEGYDLSIIESDYAKTDGTTIYSVGLGTEASVSNDPYQNVNDSSSLKSVLLRRVANDPLTSGDPSFPSSDPDPDLTNNPSHPEGAYFLAENAGELDQLFDTIAQRIKLRLL